MVKRLLIVGCASFDVLHHEIAGERTTVRTVGGCGLYTAAGAVAACASNVEVSLYAPRPRVMPDVLRPLAERIEWIGPLVEDERMPRLEIVHHGGGRATLLDAGWGAEDELTFEPAPASLQTASIVHIGALSSAQRQLALALKCRERKIALSAGTYAKIAYGETATVRELFELSDFFFMNENEAKALFETAEPDLRTIGEKVVAITRGERGATIYRHGACYSIEPSAVYEADATGAGDSFCGAFLAAYLTGRDAVTSAELASRVAASCVSEAGPAGLYALIQSSGRS